MTKLNAAICATSIIGTLLGLIVLTVYYPMIALLIVLGITVAGIWYLLYKDCQ